MIILSLILVCSCTVLTAQVFRNSKNYYRHEGDLSVNIDTGKYSQKEFELSGGIGLPERYGLKLKYGGTFQIGASIGWIPGGLIWLTELPRGETTSVTVDSYFHFIRSNKNNLFKWYLNGGFSKFFPETSGNETTHYIISTRLGRSYNFEHNTGINLDFGLLWINYSGTFYYSPLYTSRYGRPVVKNRVSQFYLCPSLNLSLFVKF
jgi:hypothetical protein